VVAWDVVVVGGGAAGVAAAAGAARIGASTLLLEASPVLGGTPILAVLASLCGGFEQAEVPHRLGRGLCRHVGRRLEGLGGLGAVRSGPVWVQPFRVGHWQRVLQELCAQTGVTVRTGTSLERALEEGLRPGAWVDASGDGVTGPVLGIGWDQSRPPDLQVPAVSAIVGGVDPGALDVAGRARCLLPVARGVSDGRLPGGLAALRLHRVPDGLLLKLNLQPPPGWDPSDPPGRSALFREGLALLELGLAWLVDHVGLFAGARWVRRPLALGVRESRRLRGLFTLSESDVREARSHPDVVARGSWPVELWDTPEHQRLEPIAGRSYDIPLGALRSAERPDLFFGGRCLSASRVAQSSARVLGTCLETGQAAGTAAALQVLEGALTPQAVRSRLEWPAP